MKVYIVGNKPDDYGNDITEVVRTTAKNAEEYYWAKEVDETDVGVIQKYFGMIEYKEEKDRSSDQRYYGQS